jgi:hypothetical protein
LADGKHRAGRGLAIFGAWTLVVLLYALNNSLARIAADQPPEWTRLLWGSAANWYTVAVFTPVFLWLPRRFPLTGERWPRTVAVYLTALSALVVLRYALYVPVRQLFFPIEGLTFVRLLRKSFLPELLSLAGVLAVAQVLDSGCASANYGPRSLRRAFRKHSSRCCAVSFSCSSDSLFKVPSHWVRTASKFHSRRRWCAAPWPRSQLRGR